MFVHSRAAGSRRPVPRGSPLWKNTSRHTETVSFLEVLVLFHMLPMFVLGTLSGQISGSGLVLCSTFDAVVTVQACPRRKRIVGAWRWRVLGHRRRALTSRVSRSTSLVSQISFVLA